MRAQAGRNEARWQEALARLRAYRDREGHLAPPARHVETDGFRLGQYVWALRRRARAGQVKPERLEALDGIGFVWDGRQAEAQARRDRAEAAAAEVLRDGGAINSGSTATWLRQARRLGRLAPDQIVALDAAGFAWNYVEGRRQIGRQALAEYRAAHNDAFPTVRYTTPDGYRLGLWLYAQKRQGRLAEALAGE